VTWQDGTVRTYRHEDSRFAAHVSGITDEAGVRYSTYTYDASGRVAYSELAGGAQRLTFSYGSGGGWSTVYEASGAARSDSFVNNAGVLRPSAVSAPCAACGSSSRSTVYDAKQNKTKEVAHDGSVTFYAYDATGRDSERATLPAATRRPRRALVFDTRPARPGPAATIRSVGACGGRSRPSRGKRESGSGAATRPCQPELPPQR
jgi:uncharacterized protein RhaS with RHS repeats